MEIDVNKLKTDLDKVVDNTMLNYYGKQAKEFECDLRKNIRFMLWEYEMNELYKK